MKFALSFPYVAVKNGALLSYGGSQLLSESKTIQAVGCGAVAGLDLLIYMIAQNLEQEAGALRQMIPVHGPIPLEQYNQALSAISRRFLPLIPRHGINGLLLAAGINRLFRRSRLPYFASWGVPYAQLWHEIERMLRENIPVILSVGPNMPLFWQHHSLRFYYQTAGGSFLPGPQTHAHYVTVTGMDDQWLQISSWGKQYYINRNEYLQYVKEHSIRLVSNILLIRRKAK